MEATKFLDPRGQGADIIRHRMAERPRTLEGKNLYVIDIQRPGSDILCSELLSMLKERLPQTNVVFHPKTKAYQFDEAADWWQDIYDNADAAIVCPADCGSCTMYTVTWSNRLEENGIPTVSLICNPFKKGSQNVANTKGMPSLRRTYMRYPVADMTREFLHESLEGNVLESLISNISTPLTEEEKDLSVIKAHDRSGYVFEGTEYDAQIFFDENGITDGSPVICPTEERVRRMLKGTSHSPDEILGKMPPEFLEITVKKVAEIAVMIGAKPEYMPALLATAEAMMTPQTNINVNSRSTTSFGFFALYNGPYAKEIGMNGGQNALGPSAKANVVLGRAIRMFLVVLGGSEEGVNEMASIGNPMKRGFAFAENEDESPWEPYHVHKGFRKEESTLTLGTCWGFRTQALSGYGRMGLPNLGWCAQNVNGKFGLGPDDGLFIVIDPLLAKDMKKDGYEKSDVQGYLYDNLRQTVADWKKSYSYSIDVRANIYPKYYKELRDDVLIPRFADPGKFEIVVAGGQTSPFFQIYDGYTPRNATTVSVDKWR